MIGTILTAAGLASQIFANVKAGKTNQKTQGILDEQFAENQAFYHNNAKQTFLDTNAAKGIFSRMRKNLIDSNKAIDSSAAITGATPEATIAAKSKVQENYNDMVTGIAEQGTQYQQNQEAIYRGQKNNLVNNQIELNNAQVQNAANLAGNAADLVTAGANVAAAPKITIPGNGSIGGVSDSNRAILNYIARKPFIV